MKILLTAMHYPVASARYMHDALKRLGHEVRTLGPSMGNVMWGHTWDERYTWTPNAPAKKWQPDFVLHMDGNWAPTERAHDCPHVVYGVDNHVRNYREFAANDVTRDDWDHLFLAHGDGYRIGEDNVTWLPCAYDPVQHTSGPALSERQLDAAMLAVNYPARLSLINQIVSALGASVKFAYGLNIFEGYTSTYQNARISVIRSAAGDVAQRVFESAAMGCLVIMDECHDAEALGLVYGENCLIYSANIGALALISHVLTSPDEAQRIAAAGREWAAPHTWDARAQVIIDWVNSAEKVGGDD